MPNETRIRSAAPARRTATTQTKKATPKAVRQRVVARAVEQFVARAVAREEALLDPGQAYSTPKTTSGNSRPPQNGLGTRCRPPIATSPPGTSRSAPISQPRYQSGWAPLPPVDLVRPPLPDRVDLHEAAEQHEHGRDGDSRPSERSA